MARYWWQPYEFDSGDIEGQAGEGKINQGPAAEANPTGTLLDEAIRLHDLGVAGDKEAVVKARDLLQKLRDAEPPSPLVEAYYGSVMALLGRDAVDPAVRLAKALEGLKILDRVVRDNQENIEARILRAYVSYRLPETYFHRTDTAIEDFTYLVSRYEREKTVFSPQFFWQILYDLGSAYKRLGRTQEAKATWLKLLAVTSDPKYQELLKEEGIDFWVPRYGPQVDLGGESNEFSL